MTSTGRSSSRGRQDPTHAARRTRDSGLERGRTITKGVAAGAVAAVAAAGLYLSQALPGHAASTSTTSSGSGAAGAAAPSSGGASYADPYAGGSSSGSGISAPAAAPQPAYQQAPVSSGGS